MTIRSAFRSSTGLAIAVTVVGIAVGHAAAASPESVEFFENKIRPVLVQHCYECHSADADEIGGSLALDSQTGMMTGGDSGPSIKQGDADESILISALRYESSEMPPNGKLPDAVIRDFEKWIDAGAVDPRTNAVGGLPIRESIDIREGRQYWAFQPIRSTEPSREATAATANVIDSHLLDRLREADLVPNAAATKTAQLRRLAFDLTGLPPDQDTLAKWIAQDSDELTTEAHWRQIVDEMLASRAFAEHWARHWMDVARYADSNGSDFNATFHEAWRYRDYLIRSFANDQPFDKMITQQIAGDLLPETDPQERYDNVVATTFLMLGTKMLSERDKVKLTLDVVDEQIDTVGRAFLGLTLGCARCHDHKFDPVPTEDYYALAGIFKNTVTLKGESQKYVSTWNRVGLPVSERQRAATKRYAAELKSLETELKTAESQLKSLGDPADSLEGMVVDDMDAKKTGPWKDSTYSKDFVGPGYVHDDNKHKGESSIEFATRLPASGLYEVRIAYTTGSTRSAAVPVVIETADGKIELAVNQRRAPIAPIWRSLGEFRFSDQSDAVVTISNAGTSGYVIADAVQFLAKDAVVAEKETVKKVDDELAAKRAAARAKIAKLKASLKQIKANAPPKMPEAMAPTDVSETQLVDSPIHIRGEARNLGEVVPRGFLQVCSPGDSRITSTSGSGRLELADWLTDPDNPVVARVFVNRVWMHLMGQGIVRTVDNFGTQGERPTHPELLDALALQFIRSGWQLKPLIREIVLTSAYRRSTDFSLSNAASDPENRLLWRAHRRRIPAESIRDAMLVVAGELDRRARTEQMAGRGTLVSSNNADSKATFDGVGQPCRSIYLPTVRGYMPPLLTMLDVADPDLLVGRRPTTNVPAQALVLINSPDVNRWAEKAAGRIINSATGFSTRLQNVYLSTLQRDPSERNRKMAAAFFQNREDSQDAWREYIAAIFASTEFRLLD